MKLHLFLVAFILNAQFIIAQNSDDNSSFRLYLTGGVKPLLTEKSTIDFAYVDESPSQDNIQEQFTMPSSIYSPSVRFGMEYEMKQRVFFKLQMDGYFPTLSGFSIDAGLGYSIKNKKKNFSVRPQALISYGLTSIHLGDIYQNDLFIQVRDTRFYSNSVSTSLRSKYILVIPQLEIAGNLSESIEMRFSVEYPIAISKGSPYVNFSGEDYYNKSVDAVESINAPNLNIFLDNSILKNQNIRFSFPGFHIGIAYNFLNN